MLGVARILVPVDFSDPSKKAVMYGLSLAVEADAALILAHVVPFWPAAPYAYPFETKLSESHAEELRERLGALVDAGVQGSVETDFVIRSGDIRDELLALAGEHDVDLIVMGTHGRRRFERWLLGSVTEGVLRHSGIPVLTVSHLDPGHSIDRLVPIPLKKILCATDLSTGSVEAMNRAMEWSRRFSAELVILHVLPRVELHYGAENVPLDFGVDTKALHEGAVQKFRKTVPADIQQDPRVRTELREGVPYEVILEFADSEKVDLIVLNTSSRPGLDRALLGSTAERVVRGAHVPVLSFPPPGSGADARTKTRSSGSILL